MNENKLYIGRDKDGRIAVYEDKPYKRDDHWTTDGFGRHVIDERKCPNIKWTDEEPTEVEITIKEK